MDNLTQQDRQDIKRYERYLNLGETDFLPAIEYLRNGKVRKREVSEHQNRLRKRMVELRNAGLTLDEISERVGLAKATVSNIFSNTDSSVSVERARQAMRKLEE